MIDAVLFDLGNVLIRWDPRNHYRDRFETEAQMEAFLTEVATNAWNHEMDLGKPFAQAIAERTALFPDHAEMLAEWKSGWERMLGGAIDESVGLLEELKAGGYRLAALTNWSGETFPVARARFPFLGLFDDIVISGVERLAKPDPAMFALTLRRTGFVAERTVFIDDSLPNVVGARAAGMHAIHFTTATACRAALRDLGVRLEAPVVTTATLQAFADAWNRHDVDALMSFMADDCVFRASAGPDVCGTRYEGRDAVRAGFADVWATFPDAQWSGARHFVTGDRGVSEWTFTGTTRDGTRVEVDGCDVFTFRDGRIAVKDSYRKNRRLPEA